ncbi:ATPase [Vallicoccus soli]|uniref:ATPase n=1 Tax=Vallicoccus soli TaxID=2339232 RepID=A0A3A3ZNF9_9ACTN|nr:ATPase [Vallicoccus soli]
MSGSGQRRPDGTPVAGVDVGGGGCRVRVAWPGGSAEGAGEGVRVRGAGIDVDEVAAAVAAVLGRLRAQGAPAPGAVGLGMTGLLTLADRPGGLHAALRERLGVARTVVAPDAVTALVGALGGLVPGAVVAAGTGAIALGTDGRGAWRRVDGWGHLLGDDGAGSWVGQAGLRAAFRAHDGRPRGSARLLELARARYGAPEDLPRALYPAPDRAARLAAFAPDVALAAREGDPVAAAVWRGAGERLAEALLAAVPPGVPDPALSRTGGLFAAGGLLLEPLAAALAAAGAPPLRAPRGGPLDGAVLLARDGAEAGPAA